jgi:hypothetical protein
LDSLENVEYGDLKTTLNTDEFMDLIKKLKKSFEPLSTYEEILGTSSSMRRSGGFSGTRGSRDFEEMKEQGI